MRSLSAIFVFAFLVAACADATDSTSDNEADVAGEQLIGKADAASFVGLYSTSTTILRRGDVPSLQLIGTGPSGSYVRARCYNADCSQNIAETDHYDTYASSAGKTYIRFWSFEVVTVNGQRQQQPVIADVYEIKKTSTGIKLRKSYSTRWLTLRTRTEQAICTASGGTGSPCGCPGTGDLTMPHPGFVAGAGGCLEIPGGGEDACDTSEGLYTDDDASAIGTHCLCGVGRHVTGAGACTAI